MSRRNQIQFGSRFQIAGMKPYALENRASPLIGRRTEFGRASVGSRRTCSPSKIAFSQKMPILDASVDHPFIVIVKRQPYSVGQGNAAPSPLQICLPVVVLQLAIISDSANRQDQREQQCILFQFTPQLAFP